MDRLICYVAPLTDRSKNEHIDHMSHEALCQSIDITNKASQS